MPRAPRSRTLMRLAALGSQMMVKQRRIAKLFGSAACAALVAPLTPPPPPEEEEDQEEEHAPPSAHDELEQQQQRNPKRLRVDDDDPLASRYLGVRWDAAAAAWSVAARDERCAPVAIGVYASQHEAAAAYDRFIVERGLAKVRRTNLNCLGVRVEKAAAASVYRGVMLCVESGCWQARPCRSKKAGLDGRPANLGRYEDETDAAIVADAYVHLEPRLAELQGLNFRSVDRETVVTLKRGFDVAIVFEQKGERARLTARLTKVRHDPTPRARAKHRAVRYRVELLDATETFLGVTKFWDALNDAGTKHGFVHCAFRPKPAKR